MSRKPSLTRLLRRSLPVILDLGSQIALWTFELMLVGRLGLAPALGLAGRSTDAGAAAMVAVGTVQLVLLLTITVLLTFVVGAVVSVNRLLGAGLREEADHFLGQATVWGFATSIVVGFAWYFGAEPLARILIGADGAPARLLMADYLRTLAPFAPLMIVNFVVLGILRGVGDVRQSLAVNLGINALHFGGALVLIFGLGGMPELGVRGSALAGGIAHSLGALATFAIVFGGGASLRLTRRDLGRMAPGTTSRILRQGLPMTIEQFSWGLGLLVLLGVVTRLGTRSAAAHIALLSLLRISSLVFTGLGIATMTAVGRHHGEGREDLARAACRRMLRLSIGAAALLAILYLAVPGALIGLFTPDAEVVELGGSVLVLVALLQLPKSINYNSAYALRGEGDTRYPMLTIIWGVIVFELGLGWALALPLGLGLGGIWIAAIVDETVRAALLARRFWRGTAAALPASAALTANEAAAPAGDVEPEAAHRARVG